MRRPRLFFLLFVLVASTFLAAGPTADLPHHHHDQFVSGVQAVTPVSDDVSYNTNTGKYHNSKCRYYDCKNCKTIIREEAIRRGGVACKVCGG